MKGSWVKYIVLFMYHSISHFIEIIGEDTFHSLWMPLLKQNIKQKENHKLVDSWHKYCLGSKKVIRNGGECGESKSEPFLWKRKPLLPRVTMRYFISRGEWKSWLKTQHSKNSDHGIWPHHFMVNRWENNENSERLNSLRLQNHSGWWLQPWN